MSDPYINERGVFYNKLGISDARLLREAEYGLAIVRAKEILSGQFVPDVHGYGLARQIAIHRHLFQDVYPWAGRVRTTPLSKRFGVNQVSIFVELVAIGPYWQLLEQKTAAFVSDTDASFEQKREALMAIFIKANDIHPFPEGNGRSLQIFMRQLAREQGIDLDYAKLHPTDWNYASAISGTHGVFFQREREVVLEPPDSAPIRKIFESIAKPRVAS